MSRTWSGVHQGHPGLCPGSQINSEKTQTSVTPDMESPGHIWGSDSAFYENTTCENSGRSRRSTPVEVAFLVILSIPG